MSANLYLDSTSTHGEDTKRLSVERSLHVSGGTFLRLVGTQAHFSPAAARDLGAWLATRYGLAPYRDGKPGDMVKVIANAEGIAPGTYKVESAVDSDDEYDLEDEGYVPARLVVHPDAILPEDAKPEPTPAPRFAVGTPAVIVTDDAQSNTGVRQGLTKGTPVIINGNLPSGSYRVTAHTGGALRTRHVRATDVALSLPAEVAPKDATPTTPAALKVGDVVALKPGAKTCYGGGVYFGEDVTRVKVTALPYSEGDDYEVRNLDGTGPHGSRDGGTQYVGRAYLGDPITEAAWSVGDEAIVTVNNPVSSGFRRGDRVTLVSDAGSRGDVHAFDARGTAGTFIIYTSHIRRP